MSLFCLHNAFTTQTLPPLSLSLCVCFFAVLAVALEETRCKVSSNGMHSVKGRCQAAESKHISVGRYRCKALLQLVYHHQRASVGHIPIYHPVDLFMLLPPTLFHHHLLPISIIRASSSPPLPQPICPPLSHLDTFPPNPDILSPPPPPPPIAPPTPLGETGPCRPVGGHSLSAIAEEGSFDTGCQQTAGED